MGLRLSYGEERMLFRFLGSAVRNKSMYPYVDPLRCNDAIIRSCLT